MTANDRSVSSPARTTLAEKTSWQTRQVLTLGRKNSWNFRVLGKAELPDRPVRLQNWLIVPAQDDSSPIPKRTMERIQAIFAAGLNPKGFVVVHEAPMALGAPMEKQSTQTEYSASAKPSQPTRTTGSSSVTSLLAGLGAVLTAIVTVIFPMLFFGLLALDPIVIAVMEDGSWVEIDRWYIK
jgi:hypothetical protein